MSDEPDNLILVYLRRLDAKLDGVIDVLADQGRRRIDPLWRPNAVWAPQRVGPRNWSAGDV